MQVRPKWRNAVGIVAILMLILVWSVLVAMLAPWISELPLLVQTIFYLVVGIGWIFPVKPLLTWMATGTMRRAQDGRQG